MKAYALGKRAKWKDYVDMYFIFRDHFSLEQVINHTQSIFGTLFNPKLFRQQLAYFEDINYSEAIDFIEGKSIPESDIKSFLTNLATTPL